MNLTDEQLKKLGITPEQVKKIREEERVTHLLQLNQCEALIDAGWKFEVNPKYELEIWQWAWRRPPRRKNSPGMRFASTNQAYQHLRKLKPELAPIYA